MDLQILLNDHQTGMSDFQDDYFVTARAGGTVYGQYKQALRELYKRYRGLRELVWNDTGWKQSQLEIKELEYKLDNEELNAFERERLEIKLQHKKMLMEETERVINDTYREFYRFYQQACVLKQSIGEITPVRRRELEADMWLFRVHEMIAIDYLQSGRLKNTTIEFLSVLPKEQRDIMYSLALNPENHQKLISDYLNRQEPYKVPFEEIEVPKLKFDEIEKLIELKG
jgi:hypothetical protein